MSEQTQLIIDTVDRILAQQCTKELVDAAEAGTWPAELWKTFEDAGLLHVSLPDTAGGGGGTLADAMAVLRIAGQYACPLPLAETMIAGLGLHMAGLALPSGPLTAAVARSGRGVEIAKDDAGVTINGSLTGVSWARTAALIVIATQLDGEAWILAVEPNSVAIEEAANLAGEPRDTVTFENVVLGKDCAAIVSPGNRPVFIQEYGAMARATQMAGALEQLLSISIQYALDRQQFGRPLAGFQAVQQNLARLAGETAAGLTAASAAVDAAESGPAFPEVAAAKIRVGEAAGIAAELAHQVHGAMGFTQEYGLQLRTRRLWCWREEFGSEAEWQIALGQTIARNGADQVWQTMTST